MFEFIDDFLLGKTQKLCDQFTMLTGHTKFRLEMLVIIVGTPFYWAFAIKSAFRVLLVIAIIVTIRDFLYVYVIKIAEQEFLKNNKLLLNNTNTYHDSFRCLALIIAAFVFFMDSVFGFSLLDMFFVLWSVTSAASMYISACMPLPPRKSKIKKWLTNTATKLKVSLPLPLPAPANDS